MNVTWEGIKATSDIEFSSVFGLGAKYALVKAHSYNISFLGICDLSNFTEGIIVEPLLGLLWDYELGLTNLGYSQNSD
jgi:hypothetical protein